MMEKSVHYSATGERDNRTLSPLHVVAAGYFRSGPEYRLRPRVLEDEAVFIYTVQGEGSVRAGTERFVARPGQAFVIFPGTEHEYRTRRDYWELLWFHGTGPLLAEAAKEVKGGCIPPVSCGETGSRMEMHLRATYSELAQKSLYAAQAAAAHAHLALIDLQRALHVQPATGRSSGHLVSEILDYIHAHVDASISVADLERRFNVSARHLGRLMRRHVGQSPKQYILSVKLAEAKRLLSTTEAGVAAIAGRLGFSDPYYFSRLFHERTGMSPSAFRRIRP